jgi:hypothetical protein
VVLLSIFNLVSILALFLISCVLKLLLILHLQQLLVRDVVLILLLNGLLLAKGFSTLGSLSKLLEVLVQAIGKNHLLPPVVCESVLLPKLLNGGRVPVSVAPSSPHELLSQLLTLQLSLMSFLLQLSLLPLFVSYPSHDLLVGCRLLLFVLNFLLFLITESLLNMLIPLLEEALLQPVLENFIGRLLLNLLL